jgi:hypothetical protein
MPGCDSVNDDIQKWMNQGEEQLTADSRSLIHVGSDRLDHNAGAEKVSELSHSGTLKAVETTCF